MICSELFTYIYSMNLELNRLVQDDETSLNCSVAIPNTNAVISEYAYTSYAEIPVDCDLYTQSLW